MKWLRTELVGACVCRIDVEWARGRLFDQEVAALFQRIVKEARSMRCTSVTIKEDRRHRPNGNQTSSDITQLRPWVLRPMKSSENQKEL